MEDDEVENGEIKPTRVQLHCNMSYDKMTKHLEELKKKNMIKNPHYKVTIKGKKFLQDYSKIKKFAKKMEIDYLKKGDSG